MSDMDTTRNDGAGCALCGETAVWVPPVKVGKEIVAMPLCGSCSDDQSCLCEGCDVRILQSQGIRVFGPGLHCATCAKAWIGVDLDQASQADVDRDDALRRG